MHGRHDEDYNYSGQPIFDRFVHRAGIGHWLLSFQLKNLRLLSETILAAQRILRRYA
jgi:hypothetical protein